MNEEKLLESLRALAADAPREAPAHLEQRLLGALRQRVRRRRWLMWAPAAGMAAAIAILLWVQPGLLLRTQQPTAAGVEELSALDEPMDVSVEEIAPDFYPIPGAEALPAFETAMVVRVELPWSSLRLLGLPVSEAGTPGPVQADLLVGQDGLPHGVRFVE